MECTEKEVMSMEQAMHLIGNGVFLGYSRESIIEFIQDFNHIGSSVEIAYGPWNVNRLNTRVLAGAWHIIASTELSIPEDKLIADINSRRYCKVPFPCVDDDIIFETSANEIDVLMNTDSEFRASVTDIVLYLMNIGEVQSYE